MSFTEEEMMKWKKADLIDHIIDIERMIESDKKFRKKLLNVKEYVQLIISTNDRILGRKGHLEESYFAVGQLRCAKKIFLAIEDELYPKVK
jgi:hypothetical protein